jgi:hypothetical protein
MNCPICNYPQYCPCPSCKPNLPVGFKLWIWVEGDLIKCSNCGFTKHIDWWEEKEMESYNLQRKLC